jgi:lysophospholipase L1-like esterase
VLLHDTTSARTGLHTLGRYSRPAFTWRINNYGANAAEDFQTAETRQQPCIVAIGNSYLQGLYSDVDAHVSARLQQKLNDEVTVYNLGTSGMTFSQCLKVADFARHHLSPDMIIVQANQSSLRNSIRDLKFVPYSAQYALADTGYVLREPSRFRVSRKNRLLRGSALVRYLFFNANINFGGGIVQEAGADAVEAYDPAKRAREEVMMREVLKLTLTRLQAENPGVPILVLFDADRRKIYETGGEVFPLADSPIYRDVCAETGVHFVDMSERFAGEYRANGRRFEFDDNYHWDPYGVDIVADEVADYLASSGVLSQLLHENRDRD